MSKKKKGSRSGRRHERPDQQRSGASSERATRHLAPQVASKSVQLERVDDTCWRLPRQGAMNVDGIVFADDRLIESIRNDQSLQQVINVACMPGIVRASFAMPDIHWGYGFPIGGVAAFDLDRGVVSPGGVGYDINCGVRLLRTPLQREALEPRLPKLIEGLFGAVPAGVGTGRRDLRLSPTELGDVAESGVKWAIDAGFGEALDLDYIEAHGRIAGADYNQVSKRAIERGKAQVGSLGSGNHFLEIDYIDRIYDEPAAEAMGLRKDQVVVIIHTGSRGFGHQICTDAIGVMDDATRRYGIELPDRQLCCAPLRSIEGAAYLGAMTAAANFAFTNRQLITHWVRETFLRVFETLSYGEIGIVYDVAHNIAKIETHRIGGQERQVCVHRKGATRAFPPGHPEIPAAYAAVGQPVLVPGDMGRYSFVLAGTQIAMDRTFGSCCHGAGRQLSRKAAVRAAKGRSITDELRQRGVVVRSTGRETVAEEMPEAYKDVADVVDVVHNAGLGRRVARLRPLGVVKG